MKPVYMMIVDSETDYNKVITANEDITEKTNEYIDTKKQGLFYYSTSTINKYDSIAAGLQGSYPDFYEYKEQEEEGQEKGQGEEKTFILSTDKEKLKAFCAWINRLTNY